MFIFPPSQKDWLTFNFLLFSEKPPDQDGGGPAHQDSGLPQGARGAPGPASEEAPASQEHKHQGGQGQQEQGQLQRGRRRGREEAREIPDGQVRGAPDGADQEEAQGRDVDLWQPPGALRNRGQCSLEIFTHLKYIIFLMGNQKYLPILFKFIGTLRFNIYLGVKCKFKIYNYFWVHFFRPLKTRVFWRIWRLKRIAVVCSLYDLNLNVFNLMPC